MIVHVPASIEDATARLTGLESLLTATEWEKAAIVSAFVSLGRQSLATSSSGKCRACAEGRAHGTAEFSAHGIAGLKSQDSVRRYVKAWTVEAGLTPPLKGQDVDLPDMPFPSAPADRSGGQTGGVTLDRIIANPAKVAEAIAADPALAKAVATDSEAHLAVMREANLAEPARGRSKPEDKPADLVSVLSIMSIENDLIELVKAFSATNTEGAVFTDEVKTIVNVSCDKIVALCGSLRGIVNGEVRTHLTDDDIDALLSGGLR